MLADEITLLLIFASTFCIIVVLMSVWADRNAPPNTTPSKKDVDPDEDHASDQGC